MRTLWSVLLENAGGKSHREWLKYKIKFPCFVKNASIFHQLVMKILKDRTIIVTAINQLNNNRVIITF